jgi:type I restriction-modification system DNA methylase subunit
MSKQTSNKKSRLSQHELNKEIEIFIQGKEINNETYSPEEIEYINRYEGSGGQASKGASGEALLYEFYTPEYLCKLMYELAIVHGFDGGTVLEPSLATGRVIAPFPDKSKITGFEINPVAARIAHINYPQATVYENYFETAFLKPPRFTERLAPQKTTWIKGYPFSLVIGNPPYGKYRNLYSSYFKKPKFSQVEFFFMYHGLKLLKKDGLLIYLTSSNFLRNGITYNSEKEEIGKLATLLDAYRLPPVFKKSKVPVDIIIFKRR